ncbi:MAG: hypothetical protein INR62_03230 [Rhodospirillales bacterium]|nr:hypothetical protein [Acetobacter sp.]
MPDDNEIDLIIEVLEEAKLRSVGKVGRPNIGSDNERLRIIMDLTAERMVWGKNTWSFLVNQTDGKPPDVGALHGIKLKGRRYLQELKDYKRDRSFWSRNEQIVLVIAGALLVLVGNVLHSYLKLWFCLP